MRKIYEGFSFGESKFLDLELLEIETLEEKAEVIKSFQNRPIDLALLKSFGMDT
jgi:hypothetical protein